VRYGASTPRPRCRRRPLRAKHGAIHSGQGHCVGFPHSSGSSGPGLTLLTSSNSGAGCSTATVSTGGATGCFIRRAAFFTGARFGLALATVRFVGFPRAALATLRALPRLAEFPFVRFARLCTFDAFLRLAMIAPVPVGVRQRIMPLTQMFAFTSLTRLAQSCTDPPGKIGAGRRASRSAANWPPWPSWFSAHRPIAPSGSQAQRPRWPRPQ
jgi:hypothetical protein